MSLFNHSINNKRFIKEIILIENMVRKIDYAEAEKIYLNNQIMGIKRISMNNTKKKDILSAIEYFEKERDYRKLIPLYYAIGNKKMNNESWTRYYLQCSERCIKEGNYFRAGEIIIDKFGDENAAIRIWERGKEYGIIGTTYQFNGNLKKAYEYFKKEIKKDRENGNRAKLRKQIRFIRIDNKHLPKNKRVSVEEILSK